MKARKKLSQLRVDEKRSEYSIMKTLLDLSACFPPGNRMDAHSKAFCEVLLLIEACLDTAFANLC